MNNAAIELKEGDDLIAVGKVTEVVRRKGWVRVTVQPAEGTPICFDLPSAILVETDRPIPVSTDPRAPWQKTPPPKPRQVINPTPIPVRTVVEPVKLPETGSPLVGGAFEASSSTGESTAPPATSAPELSEVDAPEWTL